MTFIFVYFKTGFECEVEYSNICNVELKRSGNLIHTLHFCKDKDNTKINKHSQIPAGGGTKATYDEFRCMQRPSANSAASFRVIPVPRGYLSKV